MHVAIELKVQKSDYTIPEIIFEETLSVSLL
jgi:hypothetical protein